MDRVIRYRIEPVQSYALKRVVIDGEGERVGHVGTFKTEQEAEEYRDKLVEMD